MSDVVAGMRRRLAGLSMRTGLWVLGACGVLYVLSFAQMLLPVSAGVKGVLWVVLFGLAKTAQYTALLILGKEGVARVRGYLRRGRGRQAE